MITKFCALLLGMTSLLANAADPTAAGTKTAIFAGGCFWCMQPPYDNAKGGVKTVVGYTGGRAEDATHQKKSPPPAKKPEAIPKTKQSPPNFYEQILHIFLGNNKPPQADGQVHHN